MWRYVEHRFQTLLSTFDVRRIAEFISAIFSPQVVSAISFIVVSFVLESSVKMKLISGLIGVLFTSVFPTIFIYYLISKGKVDHPFVPVREQRTIPYIFAIISSIVGFLLLFYLNSHRLLVFSQWCYFSNTFLILLINFRWKISAHLAGLTGPLTILFWIFGHWVLILFLLVPFVAWSRVYLKAHDLGQVFGGAVLGIVSTSLQFYLAVKIFAIL